MTCVDPYFLPCPEESSSFRLERYPELQTTTRLSPDSRSVATLLSVSIAHLDSEAEMRKFFGAKVIQANKSASSASSAPSRRRAVTQRSNLTRPQSTWWSANQREGLSIRPLSTEEWELKQVRHGWPRSDDSHEKWWTVDYSQRYKSMTKSFIRAVMSGREFLSLPCTLRIPLKFFRPGCPLACSQETTLACG